MFAAIHNCAKQGLRRVLKTVPFAARPSRAQKSLEFVPKTVFCIYSYWNYPFWSVTGSRSIGYARVSTAKQNLEAQKAELNAAGCVTVFSEQISTRTSDSKRAELQAALKALLPGDELVVAKLDRLGLSQREVINRIHGLQERGVHVRTLDGLINTAALGKMAPVVIGLLTGLAEVERSLIQERTIESVEHRRSKGGNLGGRPKTSAAKEKLALRLRKEGETYRSIREQTGLALSTIRRIIAESEAEGMKI